MTILLFILGLVLLTLGAELLVQGAARLARSAGISALVVGLTVVAFGTSSPELAVSIQSAFAGQADLSVGNVVGSNIFNVLFILGVSALITPLLVGRQVIRQEVPVMIGASLLLWALALDGALGVVEGCVLLGLLVAYTLFLIVQSRREGADQDDDLDAGVAASEWLERRVVQFVMIAAGLLLLVIGARWLVHAAIEFARYLGVSELVIGLTIVAAGTSLPEVATSVMAALRGQRDIAVGNVIGSNVFNILGVLGAASIVAPTGLVVAPSILRFDLVVMVAVAVVCLPVLLTGRRLVRWEGALFLVYYAAYTTYLILYTQQHDALGPFSTAMMWVVLPLTVATFVSRALLQWLGRRPP